MENREEVLQRAQHGDQTAMPGLKEILDADRAIWQQHGDLAQQAQAAWVKMLAGPNALLAETVRRKLDELRTELTVANPTPLEKLLVERVVACSMQFHYTDTLYAQSRGPNVTPSALREIMKRQESAQRRYLSSIKQLTVIRKLLKPAVSPVDLLLGSKETTKPAAAGGARFTAVGRN